MIKCPFCESEFKDFSGLGGHCRSLHKEEYVDGGWEKIKQSFIGQKESKQEGVPSGAENAKSYDEAIERGEKVPEIAELVPAETPKQVSVPLAAYQIRVDPSVISTFRFLKAKGSIPHDWTIGKFMNEYTIGHVASKDKVRATFTQELYGTDGSPGREVITMQEGGGRDDKPKDPVETMKEMQAQEMMDVRIDTMKQRLEGKDRKEVEIKDDFFNHLDKISDKIFAQRMALKMGDKMFGEESNDGKNSKVKELEEKLAKMEDDKKISELKAEIAKIAELVKNTQKPSGELTSKDIITMMSTNMTQNTKQYQDFKDQLQHKDMELIRNEHENQAKMLADKLERLESRPRFVDTLKEVSETQKALQSAGLMKKEGEESNVKIISGLVENVAKTVTNSPGFQDFMSNIGRQEQNLSPQQQAQLQAIQRAQQQAATASGQPVVLRPVEQGTPAPASGGATEEQKSIYDNLINVSDQGDRRRRQE